jgi:hypothetical protein
VASERASLAPGTRHGARRARRGKAPRALTSGAEAGPSWRGCWYTLGSTYSLPGFTSPTYARLACTWTPRSSASHRERLCLAVPSISLANARVTPWTGAWQIARACEICDYLGRIVCLHCPVSKQLRGQGTRSGAAAGPPRRPPPAGPAQPRAARQGWYVRAVWCCNTLSCGRKLGMCLLALPMRDRCRHCLL